MTYAINRSRRKTLAVYVKPDGAVEVRAPLKLAKSEIERFIVAKSAWIAKKQAQIAARQPNLPRELPTSEYANGEFERVTHELVKAWESRLGVSVAFVGIRKMSTRWGSCTAKTRRIRLNAALEYCLRECLEYVVVHELAHLRENNHSPRFWSIVADALPDYKARQTRLKSLSWLLNGLRGE
ncbi:MAG: M48 family metallopeptidase [Clostridium sp.]|nr:M48 family metallopeptidase [Clostridium sp.]